MTIKRVLVPVDFSTHSLQALDYAVELAKPFKAELTALFVVEPIYYAVPDFAGAAGAMGGLLDEQRRSGRQQLERLAQSFAKRGVALGTLLQTGTPYQVIADTAKRLKADLIVMATHGRTGFTHVLMGSVAERVVRTAACPVLTLHGYKAKKGGRAAGSRKRATRSGRRVTSNG